MLWLGIDIGSSSTKAVLINAEREIVEKCYLRSRDIDSSVKEVFKRIKIKDREIAGAGVTGSGREYTKQLISADLATVETFAHMIGTLQTIPNVRTVIDIGAEDCKLMLLEEGVMTNFGMNSVCSSGQGSTIENISSRLGISVEEFGDLAIKSTKLILLSMKCGVIMSSGVVNKKNDGEKIEDILMAVCNSVVSNFLNLTGKGMVLKEPIVFQGMTAHNKGLVKAFEDALGAKIIVPEFPELMGAYGMAIIAQEEMNGKKTTFSIEGLDAIGKLTVEQHSEGCIGCTVCYRALPKYFKALEDGKSECIMTKVDMDDSEELKEVVRLCPKKIILLGR